MRLLKINKDGDVNITEYPDGSVPAYAILSHTWAQNNDEEVTLREVQAKEGRQKTGYQKIKFCTEQAKRDGIEHCWVDTCCIDQTNYVELSKAITTMYKWYCDAQKCYVFLSDVSNTRLHRRDDTDEEWISSFCNSRWFTRGWTLQELLAPTVVEFFSRDGVFLGTKRTLAEQIGEITGVPLSALYGSPVSQFSVAERWRWAQGRETKQKEDKAYSLFGIFNVYLPLIYGEGDHAFRRLEEEVTKQLGGSHFLALQSSNSSCAREDVVAQKSAKRPRLESADNETSVTRVQNHTAYDAHTGNWTEYCQAHDASADDYNTLFKSLLFDGIDFRVNNVKKAMLSTCEWLFSHSQFKSWCATGDMNAHNGFLWIKGKPGCGKSILMRAALEWVRRQGKVHRRKETIVSYFFNAQASTSLEKSALGLYRTVVHHLLSSHDFLRRPFMCKFACKNAGPSGENWTIEELQGFLYDCVESGYSFELCLFIDALDEAEHDSDVRLMISFLIQLADRSMTTGSLCQLRVCLSSRHYPHININRGLSLVVEDQPEHGHDIATYISKQLTCADSLERDELRETVLNKSAHVFLWVFLVVDMLNRLDDSGTPLSAMQARLETIPTDLSDFFREILTKSDHGIETSVLCFQWMVFAMRALEPAELYVAMEHSRLAADPTWTTSDGVVLPRPERLARYILNCSRGLIEIVETVQGRMVQFIHETVREFLLEENGLASIVSTLATNVSGVSHEILRSACQHCIVTNAIPDEYRRYYETAHRSKTSWQCFTSCMRSKTPFLDYSIAYLFDHAEQAQKHNICQQVFLKTQVEEQGNWAGPYRHWWNILERYKSKKVQADQTLLSFVVERRFLSLTRELLNISNVVNVTCESSKTVLQIASTSGSTEMVQILLDKGADVNARGGCYGAENALCLASAQGDTRIVQLLLERGANINSRGGDYGTALAAASAYGQVEVVQLLLSKGANIDAQEGDYGTALSAASAQGRLEVVQLLLNRGANINAQSCYGTALYTASAQGRLEVVRLLLNKGANVNAQVGKYGTALIAASDRGYIKVVQLLLNKGADIDAQGGEYGTALTAASGKAQLKVVQLLLDEGAKINAKGGDCGTALYIASAQGCLNLVQLLLNRGADVNARGGHYGIALQAAAVKGHLETVQLLLDRGANVNARGGKYNTAVAAASAYSQLKVVQLLHKHQIEI